MRILLITGKLAEPLVRLAARKSSEELGVEVEVAVLNVPVAALMSSYDVRRYVSDNLNYVRSFDLILVPGLVIGDLDPINREFGIRCFKGSKYSGDIPRILRKVVKENVELSTVKPADKIINIKDVDSEMLDNLWRNYEYSFTIDGLKIPSNSPPILIFSELNLEGDIDNMVKRARYMANNGANLIVLGTHVGSNNPELVEKAVRSLKRSVDIPIGIDSLSLSEVLSAVENGASLVMNLSRSFIHWVDKIVDINPEISAVVVPESAGDGSAEARASNTLDEMKIVGEHGIDKIILDPVISPPLFGSLASIYALAILKHKAPKIPTLLSAANIVEMIDADSIGINAYLTSIALEVGSSIILATEDSWKTWGSVREISISRDMVLKAYIRKSPPQDLDTDLLIAKSKNPIEKVEIEFKNDVLVDRYVPPSRMDSNRFFVIQIDPYEGFLEVYVFRGDRNKATYRVRGRDPKSVGRVALKLSGVSDPEHALYLGYELSKAHEALKSGKSYIQDNS